MGLINIGGEYFVSLLIIKFYKLYVFGINHISF